MTSEQGVNLLNEHFGREVKVLLITEYGKTYSRLFYRSTGTSNERFESMFSNTLVPFYGMNNDKDETLIKATMKRGTRNFFRWQLELLTYLYDKTDSKMLGNMRTLLDNYFNTPGELLVSIIDNEGFWKNNENISPLLKLYLEKYDSSSKEIEHYDIDKVTNDLDNIKFNLIEDNDNMRVIWSKSFQLVGKKEHEERVIEKLTQRSKTKKLTQRSKTKTITKKSNRTPNKSNKSNKSKKGGKNKKRRSISKIVKHNRISKRKINTRKRNK